MTNVFRLKVVINRCYGGFGLSKKAIALMKEYRKEYDYSTIERHDPVLVRVVEELGDEANGECSKLKVEEITFGYAINDYDGKETVDSYGG